MIVQIVKRCKTCRKLKLLTEFGKCSDNKSGIHRHCKFCINKKNRVYEATRPEETKASKARYRESNRDKLIQSGAVYRETYPDRRKESVSRWSKDNPESNNRRQRNRRAKKLDQFIEDVSKCELILRDGVLCYYCFKNLDFTSPERWTYNPDFAEIEHKMPLSRGGAHSYENCVLACSKCNKSKNDMTVEEFIWRSYDYDQGHTQPGVRQLHAPK